MIKDQFWDGKAWHEITKPETSDFAESSGIAKHLMMASALITEAMSYLYSKDMPPKGFEQKLLRWLENNKEQLEALT